MALTKLNFFIGVIFILGIISLGLRDFGNDIVNEGILNITNDSIEYIQNYNGFVDDSNIGSYLDQDLNNLQETNLVIEDNETGAQSSTDFLANLNYYKDKIQKTVNFIKIVYNFPTFLLLTFGLPTAKFTNLIFYVGVFLFIGLIVVFVKLVKSGVA